MKRVTYVVVLICIVAICCTGCVKNAEQVEEDAQNVIEAFSSGDMEQINAVIFNMQELKNDEELNEILAEEKVLEEEGLLSAIFKQDKIILEKVHRDTIEYEIIAPDMSNFFQDLEKRQNKLTENELLEYAKDYLHASKKEKFVVNVPYEISEENVIINYQSEEFINAITGGLVDAYKQVYKESLKRYKEGIE